MREASISGTGNNKTPHAYRFISHQSRPTGASRSVLTHIKMKKLILLPVALTLAVNAAHGAEGDRYTDTTSGLVFEEAHLPNESYRGWSSVTIPGHADFGPVIVGKEAFFGCSEFLTDVVMEEGVVGIETWAFLYLGNQIQHKVTSITIPSTLKYIENDAFGTYGTDGIVVHIDNLYITDLEAWCNIDFRNAGANPGGLMHLNGEVIRNLELPYGLTKVNDYCFSGCGSGFESVSLPWGMTAIGKQAFFGCNASEIDLSEITSIDENAFAYSSLSHVNLRSAQALGAEAFKCCPNLTEITLSQKLADYDRGVFEYCENLESINIESGNSKYYSQDGVLYAYSYPYPYSITNALTLLQVPAARKEFEFPENTPYPINAIGSNAFYGCQNITHIDIPSTVETIGGAFTMSGIQNLVIPETVKEIYPGTFPSMRTLIISTGKDLMTTIDMNLQLFEHRHFESCANTLYLGRNVSYNDYRTGTLKPIGYYIGGEGLSTLYLKDINNISAAQPTKVRNIYVTGISHGEFSSQAYNTARLYVDEGIIDSYRNDEQWSKFKLIIPWTPTEDNSVAPNKISDDRWEYNIVSDKGTCELSALLDAVTLSDDDVFAIPSKVIDGKYTVIGIAAGQLRGTTAKILNIHEEILYIDASAFLSFRNLQTVNCFSIEPPIVNDQDYNRTPKTHRPFSSETYDMATLIVPQGSLEKYKAAQFWKDFKNIEERQVSHIEEKTVEHVSITVKDGVVSIEGPMAGYEVRVYDMTGRIVRQDSNVTQIAGLPAGEYIINIPAVRTVKLKI